MQNVKKIQLIFALALVVSLAHNVARAAPGEDPISLTDPVRYLSIPTPGPAKSGRLDGQTGTPAWAQARMTRYQAKAFSGTADDGTIYTDSDVVTKVETNGFRKTCSQEVGSVTEDVALGDKYGSGKRDQVVVLRGDLINICK
jgi:hypothetical protein